MLPTYTGSLGLYIKKTNVEAQKIDESNLKMHKMDLVIFSLKNKLGQVQFFKKTFLVADISLEVILEMFFLLFGNVNI